jgi:hypothetical protein
MLKGVDRPQLRAEAPYGAIRTTAWLKIICEELDIDLKAQKAWQKYHKLFQKEWRELCGKAKKYSLGLVISSLDIERMYDPAQQILSAPVLSLLEEMGFTLDILIYCPPEEFSRDQEKISSLFSAKEKHIIGQAFAEKGVKDWLHRSKCSCVYSDLLFDSRVTRAGKNRFSLFDLEMGYAGALRSIERLLAKCKNTFFKNYAGWLGAKPEPVVFAEK